MVGWWGGGVVGWWGGEVARGWHRLAKGRAGLTGEAGLTLDEGTGVCACIHLTSCFVGFAFVAALPGVASSSTSVTSSSYSYSCSLASELLPVLPLPSLHELGVVVWLRFENGTG